MILVCNAGPVIALAKVDQLRLLELLSDNASIPETVFHELLAKPGCETDRILNATDSFLKVTPPPKQAQPHVTLASRHLDAGEREVISLASSSDPPATALLDDFAGRTVATHLGFPIVGFVGLLLSAKRNQLIDEVIPLLEQARAMGYWLSDELIEIARNLSGE